MNDLDKIDKVYKKCLIEMFRAVGLNYSYEEIVTFAEKQEWYIDNTWSAEEQESFIDQMHKELKTMGWTKKQRTEEIGMFLLCYGWKVE